MKVLRSIFGGPLEPFAVGYAGYLEGLGYSGCSAEAQVGFVAHLDRWLTGRGLGVGDLGGEVIEEYLIARRGYTQFRSLKALGPLLGYLRTLGVLPPPVVVAPDAVGLVLADFGAYLRGERGLTSRTVVGYVHRVRPFVAGRVRSDEVVWDGLTVADVTGFVLAECPGRGAETAKLVACSLRSLLGWLHVSGQIPAPLAQVVPAVAGRRGARLPKALTSSELAALLGAPDRGTATGRRDYAVLLLLARLGLRAGEVAALGLADIDWRAGTIQVRGKGDRVESLPLPVDVGAAVAAYLRRGRPLGALDRSVFIRVKAPACGLSAPGITMIVFDAAARAGLPRMHAHRLRHTAATAMLRSGATLGEVGQVLRHRSLGTTAIYAKVDTEALRVLAPAWPVAAACGLS